MTHKQLTRSKDEMVSGVAAGIAEYINIDPVFVRLAFALLILSNVPGGLVIYFLLMLIMPEADGQREDPIKASASPIVDEEIVIRDM